VDMMNKNDMVFAVGPALEQEKPILVLLWQ
jgi:hypothetical protein